jgi:hypothetical protein
MGRVITVLFVLAFAVPGMAQLRSGTYASVNSFEKVCLRLTEDNRFHLFSSNCTTDRDFAGQWQQRGDTLVLHSDNGPAMALGRVQAIPASGPASSNAQEALAEEPTNSPGNPGTTVLVLHSPDAPMLRAVRVSMDGRTLKPNARGEWSVAQPLGDITLDMEGMTPLVLVPDAANPAELRVEILFRNLDRPSLFNDRWLAEGRQLRYLPGPGSTRSADIALKRGKRCFYKMP